MAEERIRRCDEKDCERRGNKAVEHYRIELPGMVFQADLCRQHSTPLRDFITLFPPHFLMKIRPGGRSTSGIQIHTIDQIERLKSKKRRE